VEDRTDKEPYSAIVDGGERYDEAEPLLSKLYDGLKKEEKKIPATENGNCQKPRGKFRPFIQNGINSEGSGWERTVKATNVAP